MSERSETNVGLTDMLDGASSNPGERGAALRRFRAAIAGHALTVSEKAAVLIALDKCADEIDRLEKEWLNMRCVMWMMVHAVGGKVMIGVDEMQAFEKDHAWLGCTNDADGNLQILATQHVPPNTQIQRAP